MRPQSNSAIYRPDLGTTVREFWEGASMAFVGLRLMPIYLTPKDASTYNVIPKEVLLKLPDTSRSPRGKYNRGDWQYERGLYHTRENGWEEPVDDGEREMLDAESPGTADFIATERGLGHIMRNQEKRIADIVQSETNFTAHSVGTAWDVAASATPIDDVNDGIMAFRKQCGMLPDLLRITYNTFRRLKECDQIVDRLKYTFPGIDINRMTSQQLAAVFDVPEVLICGSVYDAAKEGKDADIQDIWDDDYASLIKVSNGLDLTRPGLGRTFLWTADSPQNAIVESYREEQTRSDVFRVRHNTDECILQSKDKDGSVVSNIGAACHYLIKGIKTE